MNHHYDVVQLCSMSMHYSASGRKKNARRPNLDHRLVCCVQSLCNACGIRFKKEERRAAAAAAAPAAVASDGGVEYASYGYARQPQQWGCYGPASTPAEDWGEM